MIAVPIALMAAAAAPAVAPAAPVHIALTRAVDYCAQAAQSRETKVPQGVEYFLPGLPTAMTGKLGARPESEVPPLVRRFAQTQVMIDGNAGSYVRFPAENASVWAVTARGVPACDVAVIGRSRIDGLSQLLTLSLATDGWRTIQSSPDGAPFAMAVMTKALPQADDAAWGLRGRMVADGVTTASAEDIIRLEFAIVAGQLRQPSAK